MYPSTSYLLVPLTLNKHFLICTGTSTPMFHHHDIEYLGFSSICPCSYVHHKALWFSPQNRLLPSFSFHNIIYLLNFSLAFTSLIISKSIPRRWFWLSASSLGSIFYPIFILMFGKDIIHNSFSIPTFVCHQIIKKILKISIYKFRSFLSSPVHQYNTSFIQLLSIMFLPLPKSPLNSAAVKDFHLWQRCSKALKTHFTSHI